MAPDRARVLKGCYLSYALIFSPVPRPTYLVVLGTAKNIGTATVAEPAPFTLSEFAVTCRAVLCRAVLCRAVPCRKTAVPVSKYNIAVPCRAQNVIV